jgi:hypothetical protein
MTVLCLDRSIQWCNGEQNRNNERESRDTTGRATVGQGRCCFHLGLQKSHAHSNTNTFLCVPTLPNRCFHAATHGLHDVVIGDLHTDERVETELLREAVIPTDTDMPAETMED